MAGRPPKPTTLKLLQGNPGKRPLPTDEPRPQLGAVAPQWVRDDLRMLARWQEHAPRLTRLGLLTEVDAGALAAICLLEVKLADMVEAAAGGAALANVTRELRALWSRFGMTPADRAKVHGLKADPDDPLGDLLRKRPL